MAPVTGTAATWLADVPVPFASGTVLNAKGEPFNPTLHAEGRCLPCNLTECSRNCTRGRSNLCRTFDGVERCHHPDHRRVQRKGKRERELDRTGETKAANSDNVDAGREAHKTALAPRADEAPDGGAPTRPPAAEPEALEEAEAPRRAAARPRKRWADIMDEESCDLALEALNSVDNRCAPDVDIHAPRADEPAAPTLASAQACLAGAAFHVSGAAQKKQEGVAGKAAAFAASPRRRWADIMEEEDNEESDDDSAPSEQLDFDLVMQF